MARPPVRDDDQFKGSVLRRLSLLERRRWGGGLSDGFFYGQTRRGLLESTYVGPGPAKVQLWGDGGWGALSGPYQWAGDWSPFGNRVVTMLWDGTRWVITGHSGEVGYGGKVALDLKNGWDFYNIISAIGPTFQAPRAQMLPSGIVVLSGTITAGTSTAGTIIANIPPEFAPDANILFGVYQAGTAVTLYINRLGNIIVEGGNWTAGGFLSLDGIAFPAAGVATWTNVGAAGSGTAFANGFTGYNTAAWGQPRFWKDPYGFVWWAGLVGNGGSLPADNTLMITAPATLNPSAGNTTHSKASAGSGFGFVSGMPGAGGGVAFKTGTVSSVWVSLGGLAIPSIDADALNWLPAWFINGWSNYNPASFPVVRFLRRADGLGVSRGLSKGGTVPPIKMTNLREQMLPRDQAILYGVAGQALSRLDLYGRSTGAPEYRGQFYMQNGSIAWLSFDNHMWMVD